MKKSVLRKYAQLIVRSGLNVQKGQEVIINTGLDQPDFVAMVVEECYKAKAKKVTVQWNYGPVSKLNTRYQTVKTMGTVEKWEQERHQHYCDVIPAFLHLGAADPDGMKGVNTKKMAKARQMSYPILKPYSEYLDGKRQWCIAAIPGKAWAKKLFPGERSSTAMEKLWQAILSAARVDEDPVKAWQEHNENLKRRCAYLNDLQIRSLHYTADNGTDLTVGMIPEAQFCGGAEESTRNVSFNPNIPSEECFVSPMRGKAEGIVYATKPLSYSGQLIENFSIRFENGKAVEWKAEKGQELLEQMLTMDEGAAYLGECALVPQSSPINQTGLLFYNTLFDENAVCHLAVGRGFNDTIRDWYNKTNEECKQLGINDSMIHVDFMIGCDSMNIDAVCADGTTKAIFRNGSWAF